MLSVALATLTFSGSETFPGSETGAGFDLLYETSPGELLNETALEVLGTLPRWLNGSFFRGPVRLPFSLHGQFYAA